HGAAVEVAARRVAEDDRPFDWAGRPHGNAGVVYRVELIAGVIALLEVLCLVGAIDKITMQAPHLIVRDLYRLLLSGSMNAAIIKTATNTAIALVMALAIGVAAGALIHRWRGLRDTLDPLF